MYLIKNYFLNFIVNFTITKAKILSVVVGPKYFLPGKLYFE